MAMVWHSSCTSIGYLVFPRNQSQPPANRSSNHHHQLQHKVGHCLMQFREKLCTLMRLGGTIEIDLQVAHRVLVLGVIKIDDIGVIP